MNITYHALTADQREALEAFASRGSHGSIQWRQDLIDAWMTGKDATMEGGPCLRQIRNHLGPTWLLETYAWGWQPEPAPWEPMTAGEAPPEGKVWWSGGKPLPKVGDRVAHGLRAGTVTGYFVQDRYLGITVRTDQPINGHPVGHYFGAELT